MFRIDFLPGGNALQFLQDGWSFQEPIGIWAVGAQSALDLPPAATSQADHLLIKLLPRAISPKASRQRLELVLNGQVLLSEELPINAARIACAVPQGLLRTEGNNHLVISHPDAVAPRDVSPTNSDPRQLAICVRSIELGYQATSQVAPKNTPATNEQLPASQPGDDRARPLVLCFGNAICRELTQLLRSFPPFDAAFDFRFIKCERPFAAVMNSLSGRDRARTAASWEQISNVQSRDQAALTGTSLPPSVHVRFPTLALRGLWPLQGDDPRLAPDPLYPGGRYPYTDIAGVQLCGDSAKMSDEDLYAAYLSLSRSLMPDLTERRKLDESRWYELDSRCDVKVAEFITAHVKDERLFYSPEMPAAPILTNIAGQLISSVLPDMRLPTSTVLRDFSRFVQGYQGMFYDQAPIHPDVLQTFHVPGVTTDYEYRREHNKRTFREHILDYIRWAPWFAGGRAHGE